ncbi:hypothetical protein J3R30DRAFT_3407813 [Lentinula aciculospora]|uniref:Uncharacterized protein n=1 Tax=Lentinula aciculospora TaxID=153920 RepID=A0A9W9A153_9AGAR|nr:hypothetical protein J3R30DRAFT_3407813 [Lentinula aciculospora]
MTIMEYESTTFDASTTIKPFRSDIQSGEAIEGKKGKETQLAGIWSLSGLSDEWLDHNYVDARAGNDIQFSRVVPAVWPPVKMWPALGYTSSLGPSSFDPFAEVEVLPGPLRDDTDDENDTSSDVPCTPSAVHLPTLRSSESIEAQSLRPDSTSSVHQCSFGVRIEITETRTTFTLGKKEKGHAVRKTGLRCLKSTVDLNENSASRSIVAVNDIDRFLRRAVTTTWDWEQEPKRSCLAKVTSKAKLEQLVSAKYSHKRGDREELLRVLRRLADEGSKDIV